MVGSIDGSATMVWIVTGVVGISVSSGCRCSHNGVVTKEEQLVRVEADLARGYTHPALQRLANLTALFPEDLEIRAKRAAVHRRIGNTAEAGRWGFLTENASSDEVAAFEQAFRRPADRLRALRLRRDPGGRLGPTATARLQDLSRQVRQAGEPALPSPAGPLMKAVPTLGCATLVVIFLAVIALAIIGLMTVVR
jgi:hypothetical protein